MDSRETGVSYEFGRFRLDANRRLLFARDKAAHLAIAPKIFDAALYLVEHPGELLGKERMLADLWPGRVVEENNLTHVISVLRRVLGEGRGENRYIVTVPGRGYRFVADVVRVMHPEVASSLPDSTVAVLPFDSLTDLAGDEAIAAGIAENVLHRLARIRGLALVAHTSSFAFRGRHADAREIGRRLAARYLVEGSVQHANRRLRITAQLIDAADGTHVWSLRFDRSLEDIFAVEDEVAQRVARALERSLTGRRPTRRRSSARSATGIRC